MKMQNWSKMAMDREEWKRIVEQAKTHNELQCQEEEEEEEEEEKKKAEAVSTSVTFIYIYIYIPLYKTFNPRRLEMALITVIFN